ncbi:MAG TPA: hypothetical protein VGE28_06515 [Pseudomonas sp.]
MPRQKSATGEAKRQHIASISARQPAKACRKRPQSNKQAIELKGFLLKTNQLA